MDAKRYAQFISLAPFVFQASRCLLKFGILKEISDKKNKATYQDLRNRTDLSEYSLNVLLDAGESCEILKIVNTHYELTEVGQYLLTDPISNVHVNFSHDVSYQGLFYLEESLRHNKPEGLKVFGQWRTIYESLSKLPEHVQKSWFAYDHFFSDQAFPRALPILFKHMPKRILDVGGNTGKFAIACCRYDSDVQITIYDHVAQIDMAKKNVKIAGFDDRVTYIGSDLISDHPTSFPENYDIIWMSQFLDCFSAEQIVKILRHAKKSMNQNTKLFIMETFTDCQSYSTAKFSLDMASLYFTALANGNSRMYRLTEFKALLNKAGLSIIHQQDNIRLSHTILECIALNN